MIGETILQYKIIEKLGEGGMGIVYKAHDKKLDRYVALKFLPNYLTGDNNEKERFYHEARAAASLTHQNIAVIYEINETEDKIFLAMEYVEGKTLKMLIDQNSESLTIKKILEISIQACEGLAAAHEKGIVHRDIKSDNIMLTSKGQVKIMDFGLAKVKGASKLTKVGSTVGTAAYMSPEQAQGEEVDARSDIFSFGIVLYEIITAHLPFPGEHQAALLYSIINEDPLPLARFNDKVTPELEHIVFKALEKEKDERYQHIDDMLADLRRERKNLEYARAGYAKSTTVIQPVANNLNSSFQLKTGKGSKKFFSLKLISASVVLIMLIAAFLILNPFKTSVNENPTSAGHHKSLAVMYFENIPDPKDSEHTSEMLTNLLITSLSQAKGLEVTSRERLLNIQKELGYTDDKTISSNIAEQVAKRAGVSTMLVGSILQEKPRLAVTTRLINVNTGNIISSQQVINFKPSAIFTLVDSLSLLIQNNLQINSSKNKIKSVADVTTKSPEAYRAYAAGLELFDKLYVNQAIAAFTKAIELDNNFAMAYYYLSLVQAFNGVTQESQESLKKAVALADRTTKRERLIILTLNFMRHNNMPEAIKGYEELIDKYPHDLVSYLQLGYFIYDRLLFKPEKGEEVLQRGLKIDNSAKTLENLLGYTYTWLNRKQKALEAINKYINMAPAEPNPYDSQGDIYSMFGEYDLGLASYKKAVSLRLDFNSANKIGFYYLLRGKYDEAEKYFQSDNFQIPLIEARRGRINDAIKKLILLPRSQITTESNRLRRIINFCYEAGLYGKMLSYSKQYSDSLKKDPTNIIYGRDYLAWALVKNEKISQAEDIIYSIENDVKGKSTFLRDQADYASALVYFEEGKFNRAMESFKKVEMSLPPIHTANIFYGITLLKTGRNSEAIREFNRLLYLPGNSDNYLLRGIPGNDEFWPVPQVLAYYWLGAAYDKMGEKNKAISEYKKFLNIWRDADFNSPEITRTKARLADLK